MNKGKWATVASILVLLSLWGKSVSGESSGKLDPKSPTGPVAKTLEDRRDPDRALLRAVKLERAHLKKQKEAMVEEKVRLDEVRREIDGRIEEMERLRQALENEVKRLQAEQERMSEASETELVRLVKMYEAMSPEEAAPLVEGMDEKVVADLLSRMKEKKAGQILEYVQEDKAVALTEYLARRKKVKPGVAP